MKAQYHHLWQVTGEQARKIQKDLAGRVCTEDRLEGVRLVAGVDVSAPDTAGMVIGAVVAMSYPELALVETQTAEGRPAFPYIPGLLSFREAPVILAACEKLAEAPDLVLVDGQGIAHPRRLGLASHLGVLWARPVIGCAKSVLCGHHMPVGPQPGDYADLADGTEVIGAAVRTRAGAKPIFVSTGHNVGLATAVEWTLKCCRGRRLPEPTRLAHLAARGRRNSTGP